MGQRSARLLQKRTATVWRERPLLVVFTSTLAMIKAIGNERLLLGWLLVAIKEDGSDRSLLAALCSERSLLAALLAAVDVVCAEAELSPKKQQFLDEIFSEGSRYLGL
ncbi:hypothetical protein B296_00023548 [Ensete ventricosum]|uniref:Uncharacterized protein n=1 Tax=Ensete ventricosum TaxID=4639 RepID=A0A426YCH2_ENSVE|nr:hypothetical protein B296_00023548 [Ensete ventricosum]